MMGCLATHSTHQMRPDYGREIGIFYSQPEFQIPGLPIKLWGLWKKGGRKGGVWGPNLIKASNWKALWGPPPLGVP